MRMRTKKWAKPELAICEFYIKNPLDYHGKLQSLFKQEQPIHLELGCGKGGFIAQMSSSNLDKNFIGIDLSSDMLGLSKRNVEKAYADIGKPIDNIILTWQDIEKIHTLVSTTDTIERIYINFCNPWYKQRQYKKRLTHPRQLVQYREFLSDNGEIRFKTDDDKLFEDSVKYFEATGFEIKFITRNLHTHDFKENPEYEGPKTEHEIMYSNEGILIKYLIAVKTDWTQPDDWEFDSKKQEQPLEEH